MCTNIPPSAKYDFAVIGAGPAGVTAAVQASKYGKKSAVIEMAEEVGGCCVNQGTIDV